MTRLRIIQLGLFVWLISAVNFVTAQAFDVTLEPPRKVAFKTSDGHNFQGHALGYQRTHFRIQTPDGQELDTAWDTLELAMVDRVWKRMLRKDDALGWAHAGVVFQDLEAAQGLANARVRRSEMAFNTAVRLDAELAEQIAAWRGENQEADSSDETAVTEHGHTHDPNHESPTAPPRAEGAQLWKQFTPEEHAQRTAARVEWTRGHLNTVGIDYSIIETEHFILFSDDSLSKRDRRITLNLLEKMYADCLFMFALTPEDQVYAGKCTVIVIRRDRDFLEYERVAYNRVTQFLGGVCHYLPNGDVQIVAHRGDDEAFFRKMLVHENVHGFVHRYRSQAQIPIWLNEGLAEYIAHRVVPESGVVEARRREAHSELRKRNNLNAVFYGWPPTQWAYGISYGLTEFMIDGNRLAYRQLIHDIKDGVPWAESMKNNFRVDAPGLLAAYCQAHGLPIPQN